MGTVYRAIDLRLGRAVALKLFKESGAGEEALARVRREARAASSFSHPNVVTVYEIGEADERPYIASELVEGETLRDLIVSGPLPMRRLLDVAVQLADGLAAAHAAGVVHRDLTPANAMVSTDGAIKILDFGLAEMPEPEPRCQLSRAVTASTSTGVCREIAGTAGYMSPEQTCGEPLDFRSDQFSFGVVLYELATGRRAFSRKTTIETLCAVLNDEPEPIESLRPDVPAPLRWIIRRCLAKTPRDRYDSTKDLARELRDLRDHRAEISQEAPRSTRTQSVTLAVLAVAASAILLAARTGASIRRR